MKFYLTSNLDFDNFASKHNTDHAILSIADKIQNSIEGRQYSRGVFLDFSKAFDTVSHNILLMKSEHYGISAKKLSLFEYFGETLLCFNLSFFDQWNSNLRKYLSNYSQTYIYTTKESSAHYHIS